MKKDLASPKQDNNNTSLGALNEQHLDRVNEMFLRACSVLRMKQVDWRPMTGRKGSVNVAHDYSLGYTDIEQRLITLDVYTPKHRREKSMNSILRVLAHELAHLQKPPYRQHHRGRWITRMHFPAFYNQVNKNIERFKKDSILGQLFRQ